MMIKLWVTLSIKNVRLLKISWKVLVTATKWRQIIIFPQVSSAIKVEVHCSESKRCANCAWRWCAVVARMRNALQEDHPWSCSDLLNVNDVLWFWSDCNGNDCFTSVLKLSRDWNSKLTFPKLKIFLKIHHRLRH